MAEQEQESHPMCKYVHPAQRGTDGQIQSNIHILCMYKYVHPAQTEAGF